VSTSFSPDYATDSAVKMCATSNEHSVYRFLWY